MISEQTTAEPSVSLRSIRKSYGHVDALRRVDLDVYPGQVTALIGDNGAGKSTAIKILSGAVSADGGEMAVDGVPQRFESPMDARASGIETVYQDLALAADLDPAANLFLGRETLRPGVLGRLGVLDRPAMHARAAEAFSRLGVSLPDRSAQVGLMSGGQRQGIAVSRAVLW